MNKNESNMVKLLSCAIRGNSPHFQGGGEVDWEAVFFEAATHEVHTLIYSVLNKLEPPVKPHGDFQARWRNVVLLTAGKQLQYMDEAGRILKAFCDSAIPVIALKGLFLRDLYPQPELRTMGDFDLLVKPSDIEASCDRLEKLGYRKKSENCPVLSYYKPNCLTIELHYSLFNVAEFPELKDVQAHWWENSVGATICGQGILTLSIEDNMAYLLVHMAKHILDRGFGLRQLCDFVLLVEAFSGEINCEYFRQIIGASNLEQFTAAVFGLCRKYLDFKIPVVFENYCSGVSVECVERFIDDIISSGVYGRKSEGHIFGAMLEKEVRKSGVPGRHRKLKTLSVFFSNILFPNPRKLHERYSYACSFPVLLPAAWLHRILHFIFQMKTPWSKVLGIAVNTPALAEGRTKLLEKLGLF